MSDQQEQQNTESQFSPEEQKKIQLELQKYYNNLKKKLKTRSKSELIAMLWEQGLEYRKLQDMCREMYEELKELKEKK